ncbi:hypothetical protein B0H17DRAFT_1133117 [Mycena rosella]|uniref:Uncharacterized protein n=1 Tax=Mycena rosella TaxID=1033263 RepID=A0AAD7DJ13_MYCRO|nr:hypothetical protein B0H17DRAFT_1133117 [Mycena rosella]
MLGSMGAVARRQIKLERLRPQGFLCTPVVRLRRQVHLLVAKSSSSAPKTMLGTADNAEDGVGFLIPTHALELMKLKMRQGSLCMPAMKSPSLYTTAVHFGRQPQSLVATSSPSAFKTAPIADGAGFLIPAHVFELARLKMRQGFLCMSTMKSPSLYTTAVHFGRQLHSLVTKSSSSAPKTVPAADGAGFLIPARSAFEVVGVRGGRQIQLPGAALELTRLKMPQVLLCTPTLLSETPCNYNMRDTARAITVKILSKTI